MDSITAAPQRTPSASARALRLPLMQVAAGCFLLAVAVAAAVTSRWPLVHDAPLLHYVVFLMDHGRAPYRDIVEMNMPGSYMLECMAMHALGGGAMGWWLWDTGSGIVALLASAWIAGPQRRAAGVAAGALAYLYHLSIGPTNFGQRDWIVAVFFLLAVGCMFAQIREDRPAWIAGFSFFSLVAALIKPPVLGISLVFLVAVCWLARRSGRRVLPPVLWYLAGLILPAVAAVVFLLRWGVVSDFFVILRGLVPWYAGLQRLSLLHLLKRTMPLLFAPLTAGALFLFFADRSWRRWESSFLLAGALAGAALFISQGKGWGYHLGLELSLLSLWIMLEVDRGLRAAPLQRKVAGVTLLVVVLLALPAELWAMVTRSKYPMTTISHLEADLNRLGGPSLSNNIQCLDMTLGSCINVLYRMQLVQSTGYIYDFYLFPKQTNQVTQPLQARFLREMDARPPKVIVLSAHIWPGDRFGYEEVGNWPAFQQWLNRRYTLAKEEPSTDTAGYRLYVPKAAEEPTRQIP